jgi:hypothetical protein
MILSVVRRTMPKKKKEKQRNSPKSISSALRWSPLDKSNWNFALGLITALGALLTAYYGWLAYEKSLPNIRITNWEISGYSVDDNKQVDSIEILAILSNTGGSSLSLVDAEPKLAYSRNVPISPTMPQSSDQKNIPTFPLPSQPSDQTPKLGLDLRGGLQVLLESNVVETSKPDIAPLANPALSENSRVVVEFPGVTSPEEVIAVLQETGLLEFVDAEQPSACIGDACSYGFTSKKPDVLFFSEIGSDSQNTPNIPIIIPSGKSIAISVKWQVAPMSKDYHITDMSIVLIFNDGTSTVIDLLDKFK